MRKPRIVLVRPQVGENVGFVVRLAANFGVEELHVVGPEPGWERGAAKTAAMCRELLSQTILQTHLHASINDCEHVIAFTSRTGKDRALTDARSTQDYLKQVGENERIALVFGNESTGLHEDELAHSTARFIIPLPGLGSMNLSHAVAIALHEFFREADTGSAQKDPAHRSVDVEEKDRLGQRMREVMDLISYNVKDPHFEGAISRLISGALMQSRDVRILHKILTHIEYNARNN